MIKIIILIYNIVDPNPPSLSPVSVFVQTVGEYHPAYPLP